MKNKVKGMLLGTMMMAGGVGMQSCFFSTGISSSDGVVVFGMAPENEYIGCWTEQRVVSQFSKISNYAPIEITFEEAPDYRIVIEGNDSVANKLTTEVTNDLLTVRLEPGIYHNLLLRLKVYAPSVNDLKVIGNGSIIVNGDTRSSDNIEYRVSGSGDIVLNNVSAKSVDVNVTGSGHFFSNEIVTVDNFKAVVTGSGLISLSEINSKDVDIKLTGSGDFKTKNSSANTINIKISGSGDVNMDTINAETLNMTISGSGDIRVNGQADNVDARISGSGDIKGDLYHKHISTKISGSGDIHI